MTIVGGSGLSIILSVAAGAKFTAPQLSFHNAAEMPDAVERHGVPQKLQANTS